MTRIFVRRRAGKPLGPRPYAVERDGKVTLARRVNIAGDSVLIYDQNVPEGKPSCWLETNAQVTLFR